MLLLAIFMGMFMSVLFSSFSYRLGEISITEYLAYLSLTLFFLSSWIMLGRKKDIPVMIPTTITVIPLIIVFMRMFYLGASAFFQGIWILCVPLISLLMGLKLAMTISIIVFVFVALICFIPSFGNNYPVEIGSRYLAAFFTNCVFAFVYEFSKNKAHYEYAKELKLLGQIDPLTGLLNRRGFLQNVEMLWKQAVREKLPISFLMIDIDHFKKFNDTYGHQKGDVCLVQCVGVLKTCVKRPLDLIVRLGGEEFGVLLYDTNLKEAVQIADKIKRSVENTSIRISDNVSANISVSIGISATNVKSPGKGGKEFDEIFLEADTHLYDAKHSGRNQIRYSREFMDA
jgi:diguanylate cyclase (GGDEF)-like protein